MLQLIPGSIWLSKHDGLCFLRLIGDLCLVASAPWLFFRIQKRGIAGISVETQILRLVTFVARYLDLFIEGSIVSTYNTAMKITIVVTSLHVMTSLVFRHRAYKLINLKDGIYRLLLPFLFAMITALTFTNMYTFVEISYTFSQFLGSISDIPQIILFSNPENQDWRMITYMGLVAGYRAFYIPHWVIRYLDSHVLEPISVWSGVVSTVIYLVASVMMLWSRHKLSRSRTQSPEEGTAKIVEQVSPPSAVKDDLDSFPHEKA